MLGVILFVLKLLGILLLVILGMLLLVLLLVLFAPVCYTGQGSKYGEALQVKALITYLNPIVRVNVSYPDNSIVRVRILGFTVFQTGKEKEEPHEESKKKKGSAKSGSTDESGEQYVSFDSQISQTTEKAKEYEGKSVIEATAPERTSLSEEHKAAEKAKESEKASDAVEEQVVSDGEKNSALDTVRYYTSLFQENKGLIFKVLKTILQALQTILPKKCKIDVTFGTGQADTTGFIYAAYCSIEDFLPGEIIITPVWTEKFAEGNFVLKGKIRVIHFVIAAVKIVLNREIWVLYKKITKRK